MLFTGEILEILWKNQLIIEKNQGYSAFYQEKMDTKNEYYQKLTFVLAVQIS